MAAPLPFWCKLGSARKVPESPCPAHPASSRTGRQSPDWDQPDWSFAMTDPATDILSSFSSATANLVAKAAPAIVSVHSHHARASGFVWKPGLVVTADEALAEEGECSIKLADGTARPATIAGRDHTTDIALLLFDAKEIVPAKLSPVVPAPGSLAVVVAAARGMPSA